MLRKYSSIEECRDDVANFPPEPNLGPNMRTLFRTASSLNNLRETFTRANTPENVVKCVEFIFLRYRTGTYVSIENGNFHFIPFMNLETANEYAPYLTIDPNLQRQIPTIIQRINNSFINRGKNTRYVIKPDPADWYVTNFLVKIEEYISSDVNFVGFYQYEIYMFLYEILVRYNVTLSLTSRIDFIINHKDENLLRIDNTDPMFHIVNPKIENPPLFNQPFSSSDFMKICPVLSFCRHKDYLDLPVPTPDDISRVMKLIIPPDCSMRYSELWTNPPFVPWNQREARAVFRGSSTGWGLNSETNPRMKITRLSMQYSDLLNAGITQFVRRYKKIATERFIKQNDTRGLSLSNYLSYAEQQQYKYQVYIEGNVAAYRFGAMMASGCLILKVDSDYKLWFEHHLIENQHYIQVNADLSNLLDRIRWCQQHDQECEQIANNSLKFYNAYLRDDIYTYMGRVLSQIITWQS